MPINRKRQREAEVPSSSLSGQVKIEDGSEAVTAAPLGEGHHSNQKMELDTPGGGNALVEKDEYIGSKRETKAKKEHLETLHGAGTAEQEGTAPCVQVKSTRGWNHNINAHACTTSQSICNNIPVWMLTLNMSCSLADLFNHVLQNVPV